LGISSSPAQKHLTAEYAEIAEKYFLKIFSAHSACPAVKI